MKFGSRVESLSDLKPSGGGGGGGSNMIYIPKPGEELTVRFLTEEDGWWKYEEVYDTEINGSYPLPEDPDAPGYTDGNSDTQRVSVKYMANVASTNSAGETRVGILKMPISLVTQLAARIEKNGTIRDRDYVIYKTGKGVDTRYQADPEAPGPSHFKVDEDELFDIVAAIGEQYDAVWGDADDDDDDEPAFDPVPEKRTPKRRPTPKTRKPEPEPEPVLEVEEDEDDYYDEAELNAMTLTALKVIADENDIEYAGLKKSELIEVLLH